MKLSLKKVFKRAFFMFIFYFLFISPNDSYAAAEGANQLATVLCDVILFIRGRFGRAIALVAIMSTSWGFVLGHADWQRIATLVVGLGLLFGAEGLAYIILPATIQGVSGSMTSGIIYKANEKYTPQYIVKNVCPELVRV